MIMGMSQNPSQIVVTDKGNCSLFILNTANAIKVDINNSQMCNMSVKRNENYIVLSEIKTSVAL